MTPEWLQLLGTYKKRAVRLGLWLTFLAAVASGCEGPPARSKPWRHASEPRAQHARGPAGPVLAGERARLRTMAAAADTLTVWLDSDVRDLSPLAAPTVWSLRIAEDAVFEALVRYRPGESDAQPGGYEPVLARSWRVLADGREIAFELRDAVRFHDGRAREAADVAWSIEAARRAHGRTGELADVAAVEAAGPRTVRVRLARATSYALRALAEVPIVPAPRSRARSASAAAPGGTAAPAAPPEGSPAAGAGRPEMVGTGPFRVREWDGGGGTITLERFASYWGAKPRLARIVYRYEPDAAAALRLARAGEIDVIPALIREHYPEQARLAAAAGLAPLRMQPPELRYLALNTRHPPFDDARVRCALARQVDRSALVAARKGLVRAAGGAIWPGGPGDGPAMEAPPHDPAGAAALLDQAGWRQRDREGLRARGSQRMTVTVLVSDRADNERDRVLEQLRGAGLALDVRVGTPGFLDGRLRDGRFDAAFVEWRALPGEDLTSVYGTGGARNFGGFSDARVDESLARLRQAWDAAARWREMRQLGALLAETCPVVPLVAPDPHGLISRRVRGATPRGGWLPVRDAALAGSP
jgi:ABC-type transport system substrate-binding protein